MNDDQLERTLGRIEEGIKNLNLRMAENNHSLYGDGGIEPRVREVESDVKVMKAQAGMISFVVSTVVAVGGWFLGKK